jgi:glycosyltransferase involved in cell wall biosynthesis
VKLVTNTHWTAPTGGVEMHVFQVSRELARRGHSVNLLYVEPGSLIPEYEQFCHSVTRVNTVDYWFPVGHRARLVRGAQMIPAVWGAVRRRPDVVYGNRIHSSGWAVPAGKLAGAPVVLHLHGFDDDLDAKHVPFLNRGVGRFVVVSRFVADRWLTAGLDPQKVEVVHNGVDPAEYPCGGLDERTSARRRLGLPEEPFVVTYFGRLDRQKGVDVLLRAWRELDFSPDEARLLVVGSPMVDGGAAAHMAELHELANEGVTFLPGRRDVVTPLHAADVVVVPSTYNEPFGRTVIEALSTGRPVLGSRVGGIPEILGGPLERLLFEQGNASELAEKIRSIMRWRDEEPELGEACTERVRGGFTLAHMVDGIEAAFRSVTE